MERTIERTADGSATLFVPELDEHYHSVKGAQTESQHIFIELGLNASAATHPRVLEIGFGTGLNALLTLEAAEEVGITHPSSYDLIYFDAFAPEKQPEMWSQELFNRLYVMMNNGGILTTYCAKGVVRRMLQAAGFIVERLPGPPDGKREVLRGRKELKTEI